VGSTTFIPHADSDLRPSGVATSRKNYRSDDENAAKPRSSFFSTKERSWREIGGSTARSRSVRRVRKLKQRPQAPIKSLHRTQEILRLLQRKLRQKVAMMQTSRNLTPLFSEHLRCLFCGDGGSQRWSALWALLGALSCAIAHDTLQQQPSFSHPQYPTE
jgi:hypothetical protein